MKDIKSAHVRVVGKRSIPQGFSDDLDFDVVEDDDGDDMSPADRALARRAEFAGIHARLSPSQRAVHLAMRQSLVEDLRVLARLDAGGKLMVAIRVPSRRWRQETQMALAALFSELMLDRLESDDARTLLAANERWNGNKPVFDVGEAFRAIGERHVALVACPGDEIPDALQLALDADADLSRLPFAFVREALEPVFPGQPILEPEGWDAAALWPDVLDNACRRCSSPAELMALVEAVTKRESVRLAAEQAKADEAEREEAARKARVSSAASSRLASATTILRPTSPRLEDLSGYGAAAAWARQLCEDVSDYRAGRIAWSDVDAGCVLSGPPGTGKTLFAGALAASAGLPFIATSYADWQSQGEGHSGNVVKCIRQRFTDANAAAPCILFIDEIDTVPARGSTTRHDDWWTMIVTALLECLDGTTRREGLIVIAACNHPDRLDPAMVRSGRLDRRFDIALPEEDDLGRIFRHHLPDLGEHEIAPVATALAGSCSGADAARISREARRVARRADRGIVADDLLSIALPPDTRSPENRWLVAIHEAGHAVVLLAQGRTPDALSIVAGGDTHGGVRGMIDLGMGRLGEIESEIVALLAGRAAEEVVLGEPSAGAGGDLERATSLAKQIVGTCGLGGRLLYDSQVDGHAVETRLRELYGRALRLVGEHRAAVEDLAAIALDRRVLGRRILADFAASHRLGGGR